MTEIARILREQKEIRRELRGLSGGRNLSFSAIENGAISDYDADGTLRTVIGRQHDGTHTVTVTSGPKPPTPSAPTVTTDFSTVTVRWDGVFCNSGGVPDATVPAPADWSRVEVHVSQEESAPTPSTARASIVAARGGEVTIRVPGGTHHVRLVSWSQAGRMSDPTPTVTVEVTGIGDMVQERLDAAQELIDAAQAELEAGQVVLGDKLAQAEGLLSEVSTNLAALESSTLPGLQTELTNAQTRLSEAESDIEDAFGQIAAVPGQIDTAKQAAIDAAAQTAQDKADAAQTAAEAKAQTAQQAADAAHALAESKVSTEYILSRGTDLVTNGTGYLGDNTNFPGSVFDPVDAPTGARGAFDYEGTKNVNLSETIAVDPNRRYMFRLMAKQKNPNVTNSRFYSFIQPVDSAGSNISVPHYYYQPETETTLAADLKPGDTTATIAGSWPSFTASDYRYFAAWNYVDRWGKSWEYGTYTRNIRLIASVSGSTVTLNGAWDGPLVPAGTTVSTSRAGSTFMYVGASAETMPTEWATFSGSTQSGVHDGTKGAATYQFPPGTAAVRLGFLLAHASVPLPPGEVSRSSIAMVSFSDVTQALQEGEQARAAADAAQEAAEAAHAAAGSAQNAAVAAMDRANAVKGEAEEHANLAAQAAREAAEEHADLVAQGASEAAIEAAEERAIELANAAQAAAAQAAEDYADNLPKVLHGTTAPTGTAPDGSVWFQHQDVLSGPVIGQWNRVGGQWVSTPIRSEAIANVDLGKLTAGAAEIAEVVAQRIAAASAQFLSLDVGQLTVTGSSQMADVVAERIAAEVGEFLRLEVGQLIAGEGVMDEAVIQRLFAEVVVAGVAQAEAFIGENAILTGAVTASKITASEELTAKIANFLTVQTKHLAADAIDGMLITGATFQTSHEHPKTMMNPTGVHVTDEDGQDLVYLGRQIGVRGADGETLANISDDGTISGHALNIEDDPVFMGDPLLGGLANLESTSAFQRTGWLDELARGVVAWGRFDVRGRGLTVGEMAFGELQFTSAASRSYRVTVEPVTIRMDFQAFGRLRIRYTTDGSRPTLTSPELRFWEQNNRSTQYMDLAFGGALILDMWQDATVRLLLTFQAEKWAAVSASAYAGVTRMFVEDMGMVLADSGVDRTDKTTEPITAPPPEKKNYTRTFSPSGWRSYWTSGGYRTDQPKYIYQGDGPYGGGQASMVTFPNLTGDLSGATITSVRAYFYFEHWYYSSGGDAKIMLHGFQSVQNGLPSMTLAKTEGGWPKPGGRWVNIPSQYWNGFKTGQYRGVGLGDTSPSRVEYGYARADRTRLEIKYTK